MVCYNSPMKKIIVISDSHGNKECVNKVLQQDFDYLFFLGDGLSDLGTSIYDDRVKAVKGNWDYNETARQDIVMQVEGVMFFLTHGHMYGVKETIFRLYDRVKELNPDVVLFGHTHKCEDFVFNGIRFVNPGALSARRGGLYTYLIINVDGDKYYIEKHSF